MKLNIIHNRTTFFIISGILVIISILSLSIWGLRLGIDFTGGTLLEVEYLTQTLPTPQEIKNKLEYQGFLVSSVQPTGERGYIIRMNDMPEEDHQKALGILKKETEEDNSHQAIEQLNSHTIEQDQQIELETNIQSNQPILVENRFESVGPVIGKELKEKAIIAIIIALVVIVFYIAWAFRKVSKPVASWKYGLGAIIALAHDIIIVAGIFSVLGHYLDMEVGILFVTALLTVLGYSVNDTIVVYDRTRENLIYSPEDTFEATVNQSLNQTISRSINTSLTTLFVLFSLYFLGGTSIKEFVLVLILGAVVGTYSSIFIASPLLVVWQKLKRRA